MGHLSNDVQLKLLGSILEEEMGPAACNEAIFRFHLKPIFQEFEKSGDGHWPRHILRRELAGSNKKG